MVMEKLIIKLLRDIKESKGQFISIILVIAIGAIFSTGLATLSSSLSSYLKNYYKVHNLADLYVYYSEISQSQINNLEKLDGINKIEGRYTTYGTQAFNNINKDIIVKK